MRTNIQIKIFKKDSVVQNYTTNFDISQSSTIAETKQLVKSKIRELSNYTITNEIFYTGNKKLNDQDQILKKSGLEYNIFID